MITDIHSLVSNATKPTTTSASTSNLGSLSKLSSELKFIEGMHPVQITSVKNAQSSNGSSQLIGVTANNQKQFTLVNPKPDAVIQAGDKGTLTVAPNKDATLTLKPSNNPHQTTPSTQSSTATITQSSTPTHNSQSSSQAAQTTSAHTSFASSPLPKTTTQASSQANSPTPAKVIADITVASRPMTLTVISSNVAAGNSQSNLTTQATLTTSHVQPSQQNTTSMTARANNSHSNLPTNLVTPSSAGNTQATQAPPQYSATVSDGKQQFTLITQHPLKAGDTVSVIVDKNNQLQFYPQGQQPAARETALLDGLKQSLPKQIAPQEFLSMVRQLNSMAQSGAVLPEKVGTALEQLIRQLPNLQAVTQSSDGIKQAIQNSGIFSENNLAKGINLNTDLKLNLSRLEGALNEANRQINQSTSSAHAPALNMVAGAIERITTGQVRQLIESAQQQDGSILPLSIEIPIKDGRSSSVVNLQIDKDHSQENDIEPHKRRWLVQLKFDFEETGRFEARTSIQDKKVGIVFAVEQRETEMMIRQRLDDLRANLRQKNIEIETLSCFQAKLKETSKKADPFEPETRRLIDVRT